MYGFTLAISCCVKTSNIPSKFDKYIDVPLFKAVSRSSSWSSLHAEEKICRAASWIVTNWRRNGTKARVKIHEGGSTDQKVALKTLTMTDIKVGDSRYPVITMKQNYLDQNEKSSTATQFQARPRFNKFSTTNNHQGELQDKQHHLQDQ